MRSIFKFVITGLCAINSLLASEVVFEGTAYNEQGQVVYIEKRRQVFEGSILKSSEIDYYDEKGQLLAKMRATYPVNLLLPSYEFENISRQKLETIDVHSLNEAQVKVWRKGELATEKTISLPQNALIGEGSFFFILQNIPHFKEGAHLKGQLLIPSKGLLLHVRFTLTGIYTENGVNMMTIKTTFSNPFLRMLLSSATVTVDLDHNRILSYHGMSAIRDSQGARPIINLNYKYQ